MTVVYDVNRVNDFVELASELVDIEFIDFITALSDYSFNTEWLFSTITTTDKFDELSSWEKGNALKKLEKRWMNVLRNLFIVNWKQARSEE